MVPGRSRSRILNRVPSSQCSKIKTIVDIEQSFGTNTSTSKLKGELHPNRENLKLFLPWSCLQLLHEQQEVLSDRGLLD
jgi:hypothetical protein